jgi:hypothetical protein
MEGRADIHIREIFSDGIDKKCAARIAKKVLKAQGTASPYGISLVFTDSKAVQ